MDKKNVIEFFDRLAPEWDAGMVRDNRIINIILDNAGVEAGTCVLDIACGTGVLFPDYIARKADSVTGIDISSVMIKTAEEKFGNESRITLINGDAEIFDFNVQFDSIVIYNAFPHFAEPEVLIANLVKYLAVGGKLTVAHGMSRDKISHHHSGAASKVSVGLLDENELADLFSKYLLVDTIISNDEMYQVAGKKL